MPKLTFEQKRQKIRELEGIIAEREAELRALIDPPGKEQAMPPGFSLNEKVLESIQNKSEGIAKAEIVKNIKEKYSIELSPQQVQSAISYLKSSQKIEIIGRAVYRLKQ